MMMHIRTYKPEMFLHEGIFSLTQETGFPILQAFMGACSYADREGRFKWRPGVMTHLILPHFKLSLEDFDQVLSALERGRLVRKYVVDGEEYGLVINFKKHQVINGRERASELPPPPDPHVVDVETTRHVTRHNKQEHVIRGEGKGKEQKGKEGKARDAEVRPPNSNSEQIQNQGLDADLNQVQVSEHEPPFPSHDPNPCRPESVAEVYRDCSKNRDVGDMSPCWTTRQRDAVSTMSAWCGGDLGKLEAELKALHAADLANKKPWLIHQPAHIWAERLGTAPPIDADPDGKLAIAERRRKAEAAEQVEREQRKEAERNMAPNGGELGREIMANLARAAKCKT